MRPCDWQTYKNPVLSCPRLPWVEFSHRLLWENTFSSWGNMLHWAQRMPILLQSIQFTFKLSSIIPAWSSKPNSSAAKIFIILSEKCSYNLLRLITLVYLLPTNTHFEVSSNQLFMIIKNPKWPPKSWISTGTWEAWQTPAKSRGLSSLGPFLPSPFFAFKAGFLPSLGVLGHWALLLPASPTSSHWRGAREPRQNTNASLHSAGSTSVFIMVGIIRAYAKNSCCLRVSSTHEQK